VPDAAAENPAGPRSGEISGTRVGLVVNPHAAAGSGNRIGARLMRELGAAGFDIVHLSGPTAGAALANARRSISEDRLDLLVVAGGDWMTHLGVNACAGTDIPLAVVAVGTGNDIAGALGLPVRDVEASVAMIAAGRTRSVDAGRVDGDHHRPWFGGTLYAGFDAVVNARANAWSWPRGQSRYNLAVVRELPVFSAIPYAVTIDGTRTETEAMLVIVANASSYGGGMHVTPHALMDDGLFDVMILHKISRPEFLRVFPKVFSGTHVDHPAVQITRGRRVLLEADGITAFADGEPFRRVPLRAEVVPGAVRVVVPAS